jgi:CubicO group peptidase (beta-lactamase class C family)
MSESLLSLVRGAQLSGAVRVDVRGETVVAHAHGMANRTFGVANTIDTRFAIASGTKGFTALVVMRLVEAGVLSLDTAVREVLGDRLPLADQRTTVHHLLTHRSGIGDYFDEEADLPVDAFGHTVPPHPSASLVDTDAYLRAIAPLPAKFEPGERFSYSNSGFVVLAAMAEQAAGLRLGELIEREVVGPAGLAGTGFLRRDELPADAATGHLTIDGLRSNEFHVPLVGHGDGGLFTTVGDMHRLWAALFRGEVVRTDTWAEMTTALGGPVSDGLSYGLGIWLDESRGTVSVHGFDAGVGFVSVSHREQSYAFTVVTNGPRGAWPLAEQLASALDAGHQII